MRTLDNKVVVVTGAGSGIGRALALDVAGRGALVAVSDWNEAGLAETVELLKNAGVREVRSDVLDVSDRAGFAAYALAVKDQFGRVDVVVNNAGVSHTGPVTEMEYADFDWLMGVNFWGVVHGTKEFLPHLIASGDGHLVNISSLFGLISVAGSSTYNASKFAVRGFTEAVRMDMLLAGHPVGVTCVHPGGIRTGIVRNGRVTRGESHANVAATFDRAGADVPRARRRDHRQGGAHQQAPPAGRPRRPCAAQLRPPRRRPLPGRRRAGRAAAVPEAAVGVGG